MSRSGRASGYRDIGEMFFARIPLSLSGIPSLRETMAAAANEKFMRRIGGRSGASLSESGHAGHLSVVGVDGHSIGCGRYSVDNCGEDR